MNVSGDTYKVKKEIADQIYFEFHNAANVNTYKKTFDLVIARDLSLYMKESDYKKFVLDVTGKIKSGGVLFLGDHEVLSDSHYDKGPSENVTYYIKK